MGKEESRIFSSSLMKKLNESFEKERRGFSLSLFSRRLSTKSPWPPLRSTCLLTGLETLSLSLSLLFVHFHWIGWQTRRIFVCLFVLFFFCPSWRERVDPKRAPATLSLSLSLVVHIYKQGIKHILIAP